MVGTDRFGDLLRPICDVGRFTERLLRPKRKTLSNAREMGLQNEDKPMSAYVNVAPAVRMPRMPGLASL